MSRSLAATDDDLAVVVTIGNPNTGKSTLFNCLTGLRQKVSNYPGVTVEQVSGLARLHTRNIRLVEGDHNIDCKVDGIGQMGLKSEFVRKST